MFPRPIVTTILGLSFRVTTNMPCLLWGQPTTRFPDRIEAQLRALQMRPGPKLQDMHRRMVGFEGSVKVGDVVVIMQLTADMLMKAEAGLRCSNTTARCHARDPCL